MRQFIKFVFMSVITCLLLPLAACDKNAPAANLGLTNPNGMGNYPPGSRQEFSQRVGDTVRFESDSSTLSAEGQNILRVQAQWLRQYANYPITVEGHADERGTREYNIALGARRAEATKAYLISQGIPPQRIRTISYGKERPVAVCDDITCWSQNRRTVTVLGGN